MEQGNFSIKAVAISSVEFLVWSILKMLLFSWIKFNTSLEAALLSLLYDVGTLQIIDWSRRKPYTSSVDLINSVA